MDASYFYHITSDDCLYESILPALNLYIVSVDFEYKYWWSRVLEVLLSRGGAEICVIIATSWGRSAPDIHHTYIIPGLISFAAYRNIHHRYHALDFSKSHLETA